MLKYDEEKTMDLLERLKEAGDIKTTEITELPKLFQQNIIEVNLTAGKGSFKTSVGDRELGITVKTEETRKFLKEYLEDGKLMFFPKEKETDIDNISTRVRTYIKRNCLKSGVKGFYVTMTNFKKIVKKFEEGKKEFFEERDFLIANHETYKKIFEKSAKNFLDEREIENPDEVLKMLVSKFPTKEEIKRDFYFDLIVQPYPVLSSMDNVEPSVASIIEEGNASSAIDTFYGIVGAILNDLYQKVAETIDKYVEKKEIPSRSKGGIRSALEEAMDNNYIIKNQKINELIDEIRTIFLDNEDENILEDAEILLAKIYGYANYLGVSDLIKLKKGADVEEMLLVYELSGK